MEERINLKKEKRVLDVSPTILQKNLAENIILNERIKRYKTLRELLMASGYSETSANTEPGKLIQNPGVQKALINLGFSEDSAKAVVGEILINGTEQNRLKAAEMVFKVHGTYAPEKHTFAGILKEIIDSNEDESEPIITREE